MALQHLKIKILEGLDPEYQFTAWINPASYQYTYGIKAGSSSSSSGNLSKPRVEAYAPDSISFKLILDATGLVPPPLPNQAIPRDGIASLINDFMMNIARPYSPKNAVNKSELCQPRVKISWAQLQFICMLSSLSIDYKLFKPDGTPIRAELSTSFTEYRNDASTPGQTASAAVTEDSPKQVNVVEGDSLPGLCDQVYGDASQYILVAQANGLTQFRQLPPGTVLMFPPPTRG